MIFPVSADSSSSLPEQLAYAKSMYARDCSVTLQLAQQIAQQAAALADRQLEAEALFWWGRSQWVLGGAVEALPLLKRALRQAEQMGWQALQARCHDALANCLQAQGNERQALLEWLSALECALQVADLEVYVDAYTGLGNLYVVHQDYQSAFHYHALAVEFAEASTSLDVRCKAYLHLAADLIQLGQDELALAHLRQAEANLDLPLRRNWQAEIFNYRGEIAARQLRYVDAVAWLNQALELNTACNLLWGQTVNLLGLGKVLQAMEQDSAAEHYLLRGVELASSFHASNLLQQLHEQLYQLYERRGDFQRAIMRHIGFRSHFLQLVQRDSSQRLQHFSSRRLSGIEMRLRLLTSELEVTQLRQASDAGRVRMAQLESAAYHDALTGAYNRRLMDERLPELLRQSRQTNTAISALMLDFDHFKHVNDRFSHQVGDKVLQAGVRIFFEQCRESDMLVRYGGEEFCLFLPGAPQDVAQRIAERIRSQVADYDWDAIHPNLQVTVSVGVAQLQADEVSENWLARADAALYQSKHQGRNRVTVAGGWA